jgi:2-polyprenyl-6-methoxyphenol hydroxylase-like FAD-dependent oxidoreductase
VALAPRPDLVIVGGGFAGGGLAVAVARAGLEALVLERQQAHRDRVRGEWLAPWGVAEADRLGVLDALTRAPESSFSRRLILYDEVHEPAAAEYGATGLDGLLDGVPGALRLSAPGASEALLEAAKTAGASVRRSITRVRVSGGPEPVVRFVADGREEVVRPRLVVGADGRNSAVRRQVGVMLHATLPRTVGAGLLVSGLADWPEDVDVVGTERDRHFFVFPRTGGRARLYLLSSPTSNARLFRGSGVAGRVLDAFRLRSVPGSAELAEAEPAGPCMSFPMNDTWTDAPVREGVVLIGDAGGYSDPLIGQGISTSLRDAREVAEVLTGGARRWSPGSFAGYARMRAERMRRLRACSVYATALRCTFTAEARERRRRIFAAAAATGTSHPLAAAILIGVDRFGADAFTSGAIDDALDPAAPTRRPPPRPARRDGAECLGRSAATPASGVVA